ncbi:MAG: nucleotidyltransferase domain-containing protein [Armatimonadetes bacterium]|nr:nucleotidyltransferase domain-containing protein [Armatimonadota bacterium]
MITKELINHIKNKIIKKYNPEKIILFGSLASGNITEDSDIDLFLVMESNLRRDQRSIEILKLFSNRLFPLDIIVYTKVELELSLKRKNFFIKEILEKGKVIYEH